MNNNIASLIILVSLFSTQTALADLGQSNATHTQQPVSQALSRADVLDSTQDYELQPIETNQPRRSALFAHILDTVANTMSLAKVDSSENS